MKCKTHSLLFVQRNNNTRLKKTREKTFAFEEGQTERNSYISLHTGMARG